MTTRRAFLRKGAEALASAATIGSAGCLFIPPPKHIVKGGGSGSSGGVSSTKVPNVSFSSEKKRVKKKDADKTVRNKSELIKAVQKPKTTVWIPEGATIDMTGEEINNVPISSNVTLASNRNLSGGNGGLIKTDSYPKPLFIAGGPLRVTGVRVQGPETQYLERNGKFEAAGFQFSGKTAVVDNCEIWGWPAQAMGIGTAMSDKSQNVATQGWIHHNKIHHCQMAGLGYPIELFNGLHLIEWNTFSHYRHAISGYGFKTNGYEARFNHVGPPGKDPHAFAFDMHRLGEQDNFPDDIYYGGKFVNVHHNVFTDGRELALSLSGRPTKYARFFNNWVIEKDGAFEGNVNDPNGPDAELRSGNNKFGEKAVKNGRKWLEQNVDIIPLGDGKPSASKWDPPKRVKSKLTGTRAGDI